MLPLTKPDFEAPIDGGWVDPNFLPPALRVQLLELLKEGRIEGDAANDFVVACSRIAQATSTVASRQVASKTLSELDALATASRTLLHALQPVNLSADAIDAIDACCVSSAETLLSRAWEAVSALDQAARAAGDPLHFDRRHRASEAAGRGLLERVLTAYQALFHSMPPAGARQWFASFMTALGAHLGVTCGPRPVAAAIRARNAVTASSSTA